MRQSEVPGDFSVLEKAEFGTWLATLRRERQLSTRELYKRSLVDTGTISRLEHGRMQVTLPVAVSLVDALEVSVQDLYSAMTDNDPQPLLEIPPGGLPDVKNRADVADVITFQELDAFRDFALEHPGRVDELLAAMLTHAMESFTLPHVYATYSEEVKAALGPRPPIPGPGFHRNEIYRLLVPPFIYQAEIHYPPLSADALLAIYTAGGVMTPQDAGAYLRQIRRQAKGTQTALLEEHKRSASTLSRLESGATQAVKLDDMLLFDTALSQRGELFGMWWSATRTMLYVTGHHPQADDAWRRFAYSGYYAPYAAKLMYLFVTICRWFGFGSEGEPFWRMELNDALQSGTTWGYDSTLTSRP